MPTKNNKKKKQSPVAIEVNVKEQPNGQTPKKQKSRKRRNRRKQRAPRPAPIANAPAAIGNYGPRSYHHGYFRGDYRVAYGCQELTRITVGGPAVTDSKVLYSWQLNPAQGLLALANEAANYDRYAFKSIRFSWHPSVATSFDGRISMTIDRDPDDTRSNFTGENLDRISSNDKCYSDSNVWMKFMCMAPREWLRADQQMLFTKTTEDPRFSSQGTFYLSCVGPIGGSTPTAIGSVFVHYVCEFRNFQVRPGGVGSNYFYASTAATPTVANIWGTGDQSGNLPIELSSGGSHKSLVKFPYPGIYRFNLYLEFTGTVHSDQTFGFDDGTGNSFLLLSINGSEPPWESSSSDGVALWSMRVAIADPTHSFHINQIDSHAPRATRAEFFLTFAPIPLKTVTQIQIEDLQKRASKIDQLEAAIKNFEQFLKAYAIPKKPLDDTFTSTGQSTTQVSETIQDTRDGHIYQVAGTLLSTNNQTISQIAPVSVLSVDPRRHPYRADRKSVV